MAACRLTRPGPRTGAALLGKDVACYIGGHLMRNSHELAVDQ